MQYKYCQSCGMAMKKDPEGGGTREDGSKIARYCSYCYQYGQFTQPDFDVDDMQAFVVDTLAQQKIPRFIGRLLVKKIPKLERWNR